VTYGLILDGCLNTHLAFPQEHTGAEAHGATREGQGYWEGPAEAAKGSQPSLERGSLDCSWAHQHGSRQNGLGWPHGVGCWDRKHEAQPQEGQDSSLGSWAPT
jgi:hypothetical protein